MKPFPIVLPVVLLAACSGATPQYDSKFGHAVIQARQSMIINPDAGREADMVAGIEGKQAVQALTQYEKSFAAQQSAPAPQIISVGNLANQGGSR